MANDNTTTQKIVIDGKDASDTIKKLNSDLKTAATDMNKSLVDNSKQFQQNETQIKQWGKSALDEFSKFSKATISNAALGAKGIALSLGNEALKKGARDAITMIADLSESHARLQSRLGATNEQMAKFDQIVAASAMKSKNSISALQDTFNSLSDTFDPKDVAKMMDPISQGLFMSGDNAGLTADYLKKTVSSQGKTLGEGGADALNATNLLTRNGQGFSAPGASMQALGSIDANSIKQSKLSMSEIAAIVAGATKTGVDSDRALAGVKGILGANAQGKLSAFGAQVGMTPGSKFDITKLGSARARQLTKMGGDGATDLEAFKKVTQLSGEEGEAIFNLIKNYDKLSATIDKTKNDQQTLAASARLASDNLKADYQQLMTTITVGTKDILGGFEKPLKELFQGHVGNAISDAPSAIGQGLKGAMDHPGLILGAIATSAAGGMLMKGLAGSLMGGKGGGVLSKVGGAMKSGMPVYVTNASEFGVGGAAVGAGSAAEQAIGVGAAGMATKAGGFLGMFRMLAMNAGALGSASLGQIGGMGAGAIGIAGLGVAGAGLAGYGVGKGINALTGNTGQIGGMLYDKFHPQKIEVEITTKDPMFSGRPKSTDHQRSGRNH